MKEDFFKNRAKFVHLPSPPHSVLWRTLYAQPSRAPVRESCEKHMQPWRTIVFDQNSNQHTSSTSLPIEELSSGIRVPSSVRRARCGGWKMEALSSSICSRFSSWKVLKLMRRHTVMELSDINKHRAMGKPGSHRGTEDLVTHWHAGLLSWTESLDLSILKSCFQDRTNHHSSCPWCLSTVGPDDFVDTLTSAVNSVTTASSDRLGSEFRPVF